MGAHIGVTNLDGHTSPAVGAIQTRESDITIDAEKQRNAAGVTTWFVEDKHYVKTVNVSGVGDAELSLVVTATVAKAALGITSAKQMQSNKGISTFERSGIYADDIA